MKTAEPENGRSQRSSTIGDLAIYIVRDAHTWHGGVDEGDQFLELRFTGSDWDALFYDALNCPEPQPYIDGQSIDEYVENLRIEFQQSITEYPMLGRIWDIYVDVGYEPVELKQLRDECLRISSITTNPRALDALDKLLLACNKALKEGRGLFLVSN